MNPLSALLHQVWFPVMPATRLAFIRIAVGLFSLCYLIPRYSMFLKIAATERVSFQPLGVVWWLEAPLSLPVFETLLVATLLANVAFTIGWLYRLTGPLFGVLLLVLLSYRNSWSMIYHNDNAMVLHVLILGFVAAADAWSIDSWQAKRKTADHWSYGWPVQLLSAATLVTYFLSGIAKLKGELGWAWVSGEALRSQVATDAIRKTLLGELPPETAFLLYDHIWIFTCIGILSMLVELGAPLAILTPRARMFWALNAFAMHWGIFFVMGITFRYQMAGILFLSFFPVERLVAMLQVRFSRTPSLVHATHGAAQ